MSDAKVSARARVLLVFELARLTPVKLVSFAYSAPPNPSSRVPFNMSVITRVRVVFCVILVLNRDVVDIVGVGIYAVLDADGPLLLLGNSDTVLLASVYVSLLRVEVDEFKFEVCIDESEELKAVVDEFATVEFEMASFLLVGSAALNITNRLVTQRVSEERIMRSLLMKMMGYKPSNARIVAKNLTKWGRRDKKDKRRRLQDTAENLSSEIMNYTHDHHTPVGDSRQFGR